MKRNNNFLSFAKALNIIIMTLPFALAWYLYYADRIGTTFFRLGDYFIVAIFFSLYFFFVILYNGLDVTLFRVSDLVYSQTISFVISNVILYIVIFILNKGIITILPMMLVIFAQEVIAIIWSQYCHAWYFKNFKPAKTIIVYNNRKEIKGLIENYGLTKRFDVQKAINATACLKKLGMLKEYEVVFINDLHSTDRNIIAKYCLANDIEMYLSPRLGDIIVSGSRDINLFHLPMKHLVRNNANIAYLVTKRIFDVVISLLALIAVSPFMLITAILIKVYDRGPVFYKQNRLTKDGKVFELIKFRSMKINAEKETGAILSSGDNDPRITPIGRFIRKIRFDELPQLFNILKGDMAIVGPRPERPEIAKEYEKKLPEFKLRLQVKAGLTGYAQVYGKYNTTPYNKLKMDLMYIARMNLIEDLRICLATIKILFMPESTEGIQDGNKTAMDSENND